MIQELIEKLNSEKIHQTTGWDEQEDLYNFLEDWEAVKYGLDVDKHRWYELCTTVFKHKEQDLYLGMTSINDVFSENMSYEDVYHHYEFFEMEPMQIITYKRK